VENSNTPGRGPQIPQQKGLPKGWNKPLLKGIGHQTVKVKRENARPKFERIPVKTFGGKKGLGLSQKGFWRPVRGPRGVPGKPGPLGKPPRAQKGRLGGVKRPPGPNSPQWGPLSLWLWVSPRSLERSRERSREPKWGPRVNPPFAPRWGPWSPPKPLFRPGPFRFPGSRVHGAQHIPVLGLGPRPGPENGPGLPGPRAGSPNPNPRNPLKENLGYPETQRGGKPRDPGP